jgi:hypothetical protein
MRTKLTVAAAAVAALFAASFVSGSAQAISLPVLKSDISQSDVTLVGRGGGRGGGGGFKGAGRSFGGGHISRGGGGGGFKAYRGGGNRSYAYRGGGNNWSNYKGGKYHGNYNRYKNYGNYNNYKNYNRYKNYGHNYRRFYGWPYIAYGYGYGGGCNWLYRNAVATGSTYWWNRYYNCTGYY